MLFFWPNLLKNNKVVLSLLLAMKVMLYWHESVDKALFLYQIMIHFRFYMFVYLAMHEQILFTFQKGIQTRDVWGQLDLKRGPWVQRLLINKLVLK